MFLLDTNVLSEIRRPGVGNPRVLAWTRAQRSTELFVSVMSLMELEFGVLRLLRRDAVQGLVLRDWIDRQVIPSLAGRVLPIDLDVALRCAALHVPDRRPERDALIGATALVHRLTVVTRNVTDFLPMGVALLNPWEA